MSDKNKLEQGLVAIAGKSNVIMDREKLEQFAGAYHGFAKPEIPVGMVYVSTTEEIKQVIDFVREETDYSIVACSSEDRVHLTGSSLPAEGVEAVILNLSHMKRVFHIDYRNRIAFVEAGVTFAELEEALKGTGLKLDYPFLARPDKSVVATLLDRDPITAPMNVWDTNDPLLCLEVVFGEGTIFRTGSASGPGTLEELWEAGVAMNNPLGPSHTDFARVLSGSQGTLGIVSWASIKLEYDLSVENMQYVEADTVAELAPAAWNGIRRRLGNNYVILNDFALGCAAGHNKAAIDEITEKAGKWTLAVDIAGKRIRPEQKVEYQTKDFKELVRSAPMRKQAADEITAVSNIKMQKLLTGLNEGELWKLRYTGNAMDLYFLTTLDQADKYVAIAEEVLGDRYKLAVYVQPAMQGRNAHVEFVIPYAEDAAEQAEADYKKLMEKLLEAGAFFSRPSGICQDQIFAKAPMQVKSIGKMKQLFDDKDVLNRNRFFKGVTA